jgi:hypothetical protein
VVDLQLDLVVEHIGGGDSNGGIRPGNGAPNHEYFFANLFYGTAS